MIAVCSAAYILWWSADLTLIYSRELGGWCGTVRLWVLRSIEAAVPIWLIVPAVACGVSWWAGSGFAVARVAAITAGLGWLVCYVAIHYFV
jgi:hypothetical protein